MTLVESIKNAIFTLIASFIDEQTSNFHPKIHQSLQLIEISLYNNKKYSLNLRSNLFDTMQKTKKAIKKRFKITGSGKLMRRTPGRRHLLRKKSIKQKRSSGIDKQVSPGFAKRLKAAIL
jgi:large subunit ribosomal protein L35